jgi:uridine phosphorylase
VAITDSFDPHTEAVINPGDLVQPTPAWPATMLVTFQPATFQVFLDRYDSTVVRALSLEDQSDLSYPLSHGVVRAFRYADQPLGAYLSPIGAAAAVGFMEEAIAAGSDRFVVFGTCGALVDHLDEGGLIVASAAYRDEGTSYHYAPSSDYIEVASASRTAALLATMGVPHTVGRVWTTDGFYRETRGNLARRVAEGCLAVDMEAAALAALAQFRSVAIHQFLYTADNLAAQWDPRALGTLPAEPRARYLAIAAELAIRL